tara:strand:+ start:843 stop:986 length:144 start_codon:yes stop_codon:yes gene_type:complete
MDKRGEISVNKTLVIIFMFISIVLVIVFLVNRSTIIRQGIATLLSGT